MESMKTSILLLITTLIFFTTVTATALETLPLSTGEWPPYTSKEHEEYGIVTEIVTAIVHEMGMEPEYTFYPWKRTEKTVRLGKCFGAFPYAITEEREKDFDYSEMIFRNKTIFIYNKKHTKNPPDWQTLNDLKAYRIGGVLGYSYTAIFKKAGLKVDYVALDAQNVKKLHAGRLDLMVVDMGVGFHLINEFFPQETEIFGIIDKPVVVGDSYIMISRKYPENKALRIRFNQALEKIKEKGIYKAIIEKHMN